MKKYNCHIIFYGSLLKGAILYTLPFAAAFGRNDRPFPASIVILPVVFRCCSGSTSGCRSHFLLPGVQRSQSGACPQGGPLFFCRLSFAFRFQFWKKCEDDVCRLKLPGIAFRQMPEQRGMGRGRRWRCIRQAPHLLGRKNASQKPAGRGFHIAFHPGKLARHQHARRGFEREILFQQDRRAHV